MKKILSILSVFLLALLLVSCGKKTFTVTFDSAGGSAVASVEVKKGGTVAKPTDPTRAGYEFDVWLLEDAEYDFAAKVTKDLTLKAKWNEAGETDQDLIDEVKANLGVLIKNPEAVVGGFSLPTELANDVTAVWTSSDETVMTVGAPANGTVVITIMRPSFADGNKNVTLTATLTLGTTTDTWTIDLRILALEESIITAATLGEVMIAANAGKQVVVENVAYYGEHGGGYFISSTDGKLSYIHGKSGMPEAGKNYKITATIDNYFNTLQLKDASFVEMDGTPEHEVTYVLKTVQELTELPLASPTNVYSHQTFKLKDVKIIIDGTGNYNTFIVDKDFDPATDTRTADNSVLLYYHAQIEALRALAGLEIKEINLVIEGYRSDLFVWYFSYLLPMDDIQLKELTDAEKVGAAKSALTLPVVEFTKPGTLVLPEEGNFGSEITWDFKNASDVNNALVDLETGAVTLPDRGRVIVTITATISNGEATDTKDFQLFIGEFELETIEDAIALDKNLSIMVKGVVTNKFANNTYGMQDGTHSIAIYTTEALVLGREYQLIGKKDLYNGLHQLKDIEVVESTLSVIPEPVDITHLLDGDKEALYPYVSGLVFAQGLTVSVHTGADSYGNINFKATKNGVEYEIRYDSRVTGVDTTFIAGLEVGDTFDIITNLGWFNNPQFGFGPGTVVGEDLSDVDLNPELDLPVVEGSSTIAEFLAAESGNFTVVGVITSLAPYNSFSMEDATGAVAFRIGGKNASNVDFAVGDVVVATVKKGVFGGLVQAELVSGETYVVHQGNFKRLGTVDLNEEALTPANLLQFQSRTVSLDGEVTAVTIDQYGNVNITLKKGEETILVKWDARVPGVDAKLMKALVVGDDISVVGATLSWASDAPVIMIDRTHQVTADDVQLVTVTFNVDGGDAVSPLTIRKGTEPTLPNATKAGFTFKGWFTDAEKTVAFGGAVDANVTVYAKWEVDDSTDFVEDFDDVTLPGAYGSFTWNGLDGSTWEVSHGRDDGGYAIDGNTLMLSGANGDKGNYSYLEITLSNGLTAFSFDYRKAFTGASKRTYSVEITNNGVTQTFELPVFGEGSGAMEDIHKFTYSGDALSGEVVIKLVATGLEGNKQASFDNFAWSNNK